MRGQDGDGCTVRMSFPDDAEVQSQSQPFIARVVSL